MTHFSKEKSSLRVMVYKSSNVCPQAAFISAHSTYGLVKTLGS